MLTGKRRELATQYRYALWLYEERLRAVSRLMKLAVTSSPEWVAFLLGDVDYAIHQADKARAHLYSVLREVEAYS